MPFSLCLPPPRPDCSQSRQRLDGSHRSAGPSAGSLGHYHAQPNAQSAPVDHQGWSLGPTLTWSTASPLTWKELDGRHSAGITARSAIAPVPLARGGADRQRLAERACGPSRVVASSGREQLAAATLVEMATGGEAAEAEQSVCAALQQRSTVVIPAAPNQPVRRTHAAMPVAQHLQYGSYIQPAAPASPFGSVKMQPPPTAPPCCSVKPAASSCGVSLQHPPAAAFPQSVSCLDTLAASP